MTRSYTPSQIADEILAGNITRDSVFVLMSDIENLRQIVVDFACDCDEATCCAGWDVDECDRNQARNVLEGKP